MTLFLQLIGIYNILKTKNSIKMLLFTIFAFTFLLTFTIVESYISDKVKRKQDTLNDGLSYTSQDSKVPDFISIDNITEKKISFFKFMRPIIETENAKIIIKRESIINIFNKKKPDQNELSTAIKIAFEYGLTNFDIYNPNERAELLSRVDIIPVQLALVQSANETAWGTSRFAKLGNNMFGQWCFNIGEGIVPANRDKGATHEVAKFNSINESVASYLRNLNTSTSYKLFRKIRQDSRLQDKTIDPIILATGLIKYSSMGKKYVKILVSMIKSNKKYM